jgi:transcriptional regulator with XRE-family HTH domain
MSLRLSELGPLVRKTRGASGVRAAAAEVGISSATFSRIENGQMPDLETFAKVCEWLRVDPTEFLGTARKPDAPELAAVHFKKDRAINLATATSLAKVILAAQTALQARAALTE